MESTPKKRGRPPKAAKEVKDNNQIQSKKVKVQDVTTPDNKTKDSPTQDAAQLLNEVAPDDSSLTIKLEFDETPYSPIGSANLSKYQPMEEIKTEPNSPSNLNIGDEVDDFEFLDTPFTSRGDMVLNMDPITETEQETHSELYESTLMDNISGYDWCKEVGDCLFYFFWRSLPENPETNGEKFLEFRVYNGMRNSPEPANGPIKEFTPYEAFTEIWNKEVMENILCETNKNGNQTGSTKWIDTTEDELYVFLAITLSTNMFAIKDLQEYWTDETSVDGINFTQAMTYERFKTLNHVISFSNADLSNLTKPQAKVSETKFIIDGLNKNFATLYQLGQDVVFDEPYHICKKDGKFLKVKKMAGIKEVNICDGKTGYVRSVIVTAAKDDSYVPPRGISPILILKFMEANKDKGHTIWCDNIFNCPLLVRVARNVLRCNFVGTLGITDNIDREYTIIKKEDLKDGQVTGAYDDLDYILWRDKDNLITLVSTYHGKATNEEIGRTAPEAFVDFGNTVASLDRRDKILAEYTVDVESKDWTQIMFDRLLNFSVFNSSVLCKKTEHTPDSHRKFRIDLAQELISQHGVINPETSTEPILSSEQHAVSNVIPSEPLLPTIELVPSAVKEETLEERIVLPESFWKHFPEEFGVVPGKKRQKIKKACALCRKPSQMYCPACSVALCLSSCHRLYHSVLSQ